MYSSRIVPCTFDYLLHGGEPMFSFASVPVSFAVVYLSIPAVRARDLPPLGKYLTKQRTLVQITATVLFTVLPNNESGKLN